jgi:hypothetical protein
MADPIIAHSDVTTSSSANRAKVAAMTVFIDQIDDVDAEFEVIGQGTALANRAGR